MDDSIEPKYDDQEHTLKEDLNPQGSDITSKFGYQDNGSVSAIAQQQTVVRQETIVQKDLGMQEPVAQEQPVQNVGPIQYKKRRKSACSVIGCGCLSVILFFVILAVILVAVVVSENRSWSESFQEDKQRMVSVSSDSYSEDLYTEIITRAGEFSEDPAETHFIELSPEEVATILYKVIGDSIPEGSELEEVVIDPGVGEWIMYIDVRYNDIDFPWLMVDIVEDESQGMNIAIERARIGVIKLRRDGPLNILGKLNDGYLNGVNFVSDSDVTGRELVNIELEREGLFIKGELE